MAAKGPLLSPKTVVVVFFSLSVVSPRVVLVRVVLVLSDRLIEESGRAATST